MRAFFNGKINARNENSASKDDTCCHQNRTRFIFQKYLHNQLPARVPKYLNSSVFHKMIVLGICEINSLNMSRQSVDKRFSDKV